MQSIGTLLMVLYTVSVIAAVLVTTMIYYKQYPQPFEGDGCRSDQCNDYALLLTSSINASVSPCESFTRFVCSGWERRNELSVREHFYSLGLERVMRMNTDERASSPSSLKQAAAVYTSCDDVLSGRTDELPSVKRALLEAGITWPHAQPQVDLLFTLLYTSLKLNWDAVLHVRHRLARNKTTVLVNPGRAFYRFAERDTFSASWVAFKAYFKTLRRSFDRGEENNASLDETLEIEKSIAARLLPHYYFRTSSLNPLTAPPTIGIQDIKWLNALARLNYSHSADFELVTTGPRFVNAFLEYWKDHGEAAAFLLTSWCTVQLAALYANQELIFSYYGGHRSVALARHSAFCFGSAYAFSGEAFFSSYINLALRGDVREEAERVTRSVGNAFLRRLSLWPHFVEDVTVVTNWSTLSKAFGAFDAQGTPHRDSAGLTASSSFVENWRKSALIPANEEDDDVVRSISSLHMSSQLLENKAFQLIPLSLSFPTFDPQLTPALNYGGLGGHVAAALAWLMVGAYSMDSRTADAINKLTACIEDNPSPALIVDSPVTEALTASALVDAYKADAAAQEKPIPKLQDYNGTQLLFMALCFANCRGSEFRNEDRICDLAMKQVKEFALAFKCAPETPLNPAQRCGVP
ncbi:hypothetical protein HPB48_005594 [Haemaphysalis longicornis]|uniref:Peptidase M13 N-terminal domain-containing protein n=1 Tax=Haemaphysalis longicornis TaxID=44386 RepID=A0A9J6GFX2_HAELO|nr:hypothetical protein HPB48_005594 [Haemaphysalis longicornis]